MNEETESMTPHSLKTTRGDVVLIEYHSDSTVARVITRESGALCEYLFAQSTHDNTTYIDEENSCSARVVDMNGWARRDPLSPVWYVDGLPMRRWLREGKIRDEYGNRDSIYGAVRTAEDLAALGMRRIAEPLTADPFEGAEDLDSDSLDWCQFCGPMRSSYDNICRHLFDAGDGMEGPGEDSYREPYPVPDGFKRLVRRLGCARHLLAHMAVGELPKLRTWGSMLGPSSVETTLAGRSFDDAFQRISNDPGAHEDDYQQGFLWMSAMDAQTTGFNGSVVTWLREEIAAQDARRATDDATYAVRVYGRWHARRCGRGMTFAAALAKATALRAKGERSVVIARRVARVP